jgi:dienelactone hydrolase
MNTHKRHLPVFVLIAALQVACSAKPAIPQPPPASLWEGQQYDGVYTIEVDQPSALFDAPLAIRITGLRLDQPVTVRARLTARDGQVLESFTTFIADGEGVVEMGSAAPLYGTYTGADAMGLFWSMRATGEKEEPQAGADALSPMRVTLTAEANGRGLARLELERLRVLDETRVTRQPVEQEGLVGTLFYPTASGPHPTVIWLGGSEGGLREGFAALLASHGYATLALAYFGVDPLPDELVEIPLEYFADAITWLKTQPMVDPERIALMGGSKGAELALLLAATFPKDICAVVAYKPSSVVWAGLPQNPADNFQGPKSSWTLNGEPLPFVNGAFTFDLLKLLAGQDAALRSSYEEGLKDEAAVAAALIPVEKIKGPVLLISGGDDQLWPSAPMGEMVLERLEAHNHPYTYEHLVYDDAGHEVAIPYGPMMASTQSGHVLLGGTPEANAYASADSWPRVLVFLEKHLK